MTLIPKEESGTPSFIAAVGSYVFAIDGQAMSRVSMGFSAVGAPWQFATGACAALTERGRQIDASFDNPIMLGKLAMRAAVAVFDACRAPFDWISTTGERGAFSG